MDKIQLKNHHHLRKELEEMEGRISHKESVIHGVGAQVLSDEPSGSVKIGLIDKIAHLADSKKERDKLKLQVEGEEAAIKKLIKKLDRPRERELMRRRYLSGQGWGVIANDMGYTKSHVKNLHGRVLKRLFS